MKEVIIYGGLYSFMAEFYLNKLNEIPVGEDFTVRLHTQGGNVLSTWGILAKINEMRKAGAKATLKIDGMSASMGILFLPFFDEVEALNVSKFMMHIAVLDNENASQEEQEQTKVINKEFYDILKAKINDDKLKEIKGIGLREIFASKNQSDYWFTAKDMKALGLITKIVNLTPEFQASIRQFGDIVDENFIEINSHNKNENKKSMTIVELKASHPELVSALLEEGVKAERARVNAWLAWLETDAKTVVASIKENKTLDAVAISELSVKAATAARVGSHKADNIEGVETSETKTAEQVKAAAEDAFWNAVNNKK